MSRIFSFLLMLVIFAPSVCLADDIETISDIHAVTVYTNRAKLDRRAVVDLPAGSHTIIFKDLPAGVLPDSLQIEGTAKADVTFGALSYKQAFETDLASPREKELNDKLVALRDQRKGFEAEKTALAAQKTFLDNLGKQAGLRENEDIAAIDLKPDQWAAAAEAIRSGVSGILKSNLDYDVKIRDLDKEIQKVMQEINQLRTGQKVTWQVTVPVEVAAATKLTADLSYQVNQATWQPIYDARLDTESGDLKLVQYGVVRQQTGEDWKDAALTLSTAQPQRGAGLPDLNPMWVDLLQTASFGVGGGASMGYKATLAESNMQRTEQALRMADSAMPAPVAAPVNRLRLAEEKTARFVQANIETGGFVSEYKIPGPNTVKADGTESKLLIGAFETDSHLQIEVKPQFATEAYLVARAKLKGDAPILPGPVNLFRDGAYVGQSHMPLRRPGEEQSLSFGIDDQVSVKRRVLKDERSAEGIISKDNVLTRHFVTEIQNLHSKAVDVVALETTPAAKDEKIRVEILKNATTQGYETDKDNIKGMLAWTLHFEPKEKKELKLGWEVSWPKDRSISGL